MTSILNLQNKKQNREKIFGLTAYSYKMASIIDRHCDFILVGDSLGSVVYGYENTLYVTLDMMILHGEAVRRASKNALVIVDMPFGSYEESKEVAFRNAAKIVQQTSCHAVKVESANFTETVKYLTNRGIPVMGHIGLTPQHIHQIGKYRYFNDTMELLNDARKLEEAGAFAIVLECINADTAHYIARHIDIPLIGVGTKNCDGVLYVSDDILGFNEVSPKFAPQYGNLLKDAELIIQKFVKE